MAKRRRNSMALFEVVSKDKRKGHKAPLAVPGWMKEQPEPDAPPEPAQSELPEQYIGQPEPQARPDDEPQAMPAGDAEVAPAASCPVAGSPGRSDDERGAMFAIADGRVTISLNYISCAVAGVGLLLAIVAAFVLGYATSPTDPSAETGPEKPPARAGLVLGNSPAPATQRVRGKHYLVIQELGRLTPAVKAEGLAIAAYCKVARDDPAEVISDGRQYVVLSGKPFDDPNNADAREYAADIHALGTRYKADMKRNYDFNQMDKTGMLEPWFRQEP